jgi:hypothetical protein
VEHQAGRIEYEGGIGLDARIAPPLSVLPFHQQHAVGEVLSETQLGLVLDLILHFVHGKWKNLDIHGKQSSGQSGMPQNYYHILTSYGKAKNIVDKTEPICFIAASKRA